MRADQQRGGQSDLDLTTVLALAGALAAAVAFGIVNPKGIAAGAVAWLIEHQVLVRVDEALVPLGLGAGVGGRQVAILLCLLVGAAATRRLRRGRGEQAKAKSKAPDGGRGR